MSDESVAADYLRSKSALRPALAIVSGSGLGSLADTLANAQTIPFADIPGFPRATVEGHPGDLCFGTLHSKLVCVVRGRVHFYEGHPMSQVTFYVRVLRALGI